MTLVLDTGPVVAALDAADPQHEACVELLGRADEELVVPTLVLAEIDYVCHERLTSETWTSFLEDVLGGAYAVAPPTTHDLARCLELQSTYRDLGLGVVDASVIALVERYGEPKVATLDRRHFGTVRPVHVAVLELLPA